MSQSTTALLLPEVGAPFELREVFLSPLQPDEVLVEIRATGLCHTDLSFANGTLPCASNAVLGHEGGGVVIEAGSAATDLHPGDLVLLSFSHCETCASCQSGHPAYCHSFPDRNFYGHRPDGSRAMSLTPSATSGDDGIFSSFFGQSSFARRTLAHRSCVVKVPAGTDLTLFAPLGCGIQTGAGAVLNTLNVTPGSSLVVFGAGSVGMSSIMAGAIRGAKTIIAVDLQSERLDLAKTLGATHGIQAGPDTDVVAEIRRLCPPNGANFAVDCTGSAKVVRTMIDSLGTRGRAATVGAPAFGVEVPIHIMDLLIFGKEYVGCGEGDSLPAKFIPYLIEQHAQGKLPLEKMITVYKMADYEKAIHDVHSGKTIKAILTWE